ncbi:hypothetical protein EJB05_22763, partial [Eragrostis curvula]
MIVISIFGTKSSVGTMERTRRCWERTLEAEKINKGVQVKLEAQVKSASSQFRSPGAVCTKTVAQIAYRCGFVRSTY